MPLSLIYVPNLFCVCLYVFGKRNTQHARCDTTPRTCDTDKAYLKSLRAGFCASQGQAYVVPNDLQYQVFHKTDQHYAVSEISAKRFEIRWDDFKNRLEIYGAYFQNPGT
jgi:hypothetical protein